MSPSADNDRETGSDKPSLIGRIVRVRLLGTVFVILLLILGYAYFFLDDHVEWLLETTLSRGVGAEVNVAHLETGWLSPGLRIDQLRATDPEAPDRNMVEVGELSVSLNLDALLQAKIVVEQAALRGVGFDTPRESTGWVAEDGGDWSWVLTTTKNLLETSYRRQAEGTFFGDVTGLLGDQSSENLLEEYRSELEAPAKLDGLRTKINEKTDTLRRRVDELPDQQELEDLRATVDELKNREGDLGSLVQGASELKKIRDRLKSFKLDLKQFREEYESASSSLQESTRDLEGTIAADRDSLKNKFSLPSLTLENPSADLFDRFVRERLGRLHGTLEYAKPYLPTGGTSKDTVPGKSEPDEKPTPQYAEGVGRSYRFPTRQGYPGFWLKRFDFGTKGSAEKSINLWGNLTNVSTYPPAVGEPVEGTFEISGLDRPARGISGDFRSDRDELSYSLSLKELQLSNWKLAEGNSFTLGLGATTGRIDYSGTSRGGSTRSTLELTVPSPEFEVRTPRDDMTEVLRDSLDGIGTLTVRAELNPSQSSSPLITSNLDDALRSGLSGYFENQLKSARTKLVHQYNETIADQRKELQSQISEFRERYESLLSEKQKKLDEITDRINEKVETKKRDVKLPDFDF